MAAVEALFNTIAEHCSTLLVTKPTPSELISTLVDTADDLLNVWARTAKPVPLKRAHFSLPSLIPNKVATSQPE